MREEIVSVHNPRVKMWASLLDKKGRSEHKRYLLEGVHLVKEALVTGVELETLIFAHHQELPDELKAWQSDNRWVHVSEAVLAKCCSTKTPQPVLAVAHISDAPPESFLAASLVLVADGVQDPGNIGTMIRSAAAVGADAVILGAGSADLYAPKTVRATMGAMFHIPVLQLPNFDQLHAILKHVRETGTQLLVAGIDGAQVMYEVDFVKPTWLILGNEGSGGSKEVAALATHSVFVPMSGRTESLNVAMATTVLLYEAYRHRRGQFI
jgi:TrmH family RNA methyltransferase